MTKYPANRADPYINPQSGVMRNLLGIANEHELDRAEAALVAVRTHELQISPVPGAFDLAHLRAIHQRLFSDVYDWAGEIRTVDITKGTSRFASYEQIEWYAPQITTPLARENHLKHLEADAFSDRAGHYMGELNALHPFRDGNGRTIRQFVSELARGAGYQIDWQGVSRESMTDASISAFLGDSTAMTKLILKNLRDLDREQAFHLATSASEDSVQLVHAEHGRSYSGTVIGLTERYVVQANHEVAGEVILHNRRAIQQAANLPIGRDVGIHYVQGAADQVEVSENGLDASGPAGQKPI